MATCARCAQCMKVCPTNVIQPAVFAAGVEGFMTPQMDYRRAYCDWSCNECGKVCPTQAIRSARPRGEAAQGHRPRLHRPQHLHPLGGGTRLPGLPGALPHPRQGHRLRHRRGRPGTRPGPRGGGHAGVKLPSVIPERCNGCGICEHYCPVANEAAIRVRSVAQTGLLSR